ncbi:helix-turn-helix domain-containing protein [Paenibacillus sp. 1P07SE]|uniref:AraC family transcriptional regulator n=1 Tax=Paenibacillus sp. 1P07SE TaxID=3132209 RepID=UPI0039A67B76
MSISTDTPLLTFLVPPMPYLIDSDLHMYEPGQSYPGRVNRGTFDLLYVREGALDLQEGGYRMRVEAGEGVILRPDRRLEGNRPCETKTIFEWLHFQTAGEWEERGGGAAGEDALRGDHYLYALHLPKQMHMREPERAGALLQQLREATEGSEQTAFWQRQQVFQQLLQLLDEQWRGHGAPNSLGVAERAATFLKRQYRTQITNTQLGRELQLHPNYIARCMLEVYGFTPQQFLLLYRMDQAKLLLVKTDWPVARIAEETGFRQTPHFSRTFSEHAGLSPLQYRKQFTGR